MTRYRALLLLVFLLLLSSAHPPWAAGAEETPFRVGVILDTETLIGNVSRTCIAMAVEDFYAAHPGYKTRVDLHFRNSGGEAVGAASAALDLLNQVEVQAILGPQRSIQAKFVIELGRRTQVPIVAFSAKSPSLSPTLSPYFIRAAMDDSSQAKAIAAIVNNFHWREVVPIFEDSEYGNGMTRSLVEELQEKGAAVPYRSMIPLAATPDQISSELLRLKGMRTRVFVLHASYALGVTVFTQAKEVGMMGRDYVWLTTYSLTAASDIVGATAVDVMQGVVGVKPYLRQTPKLTNFKRRWARRFKEENPGTALTEPLVFGLWAYDAVWALAMAAEKIGPADLARSRRNSSSEDFGGLRQSPIGSKLLHSIMNVDFEGLTGRFRLVEGQLDSSTSEIVNLLREGPTRVGFWTAAKGVTRHLTNGTGLRRIIWPGDQRETPKGWEWPMQGKSLTIGVPVRPGFGHFVDVRRDPETGRYHFDGFCIKVFNAVMDSLPYKVPFDYVAFDDGTGDNNGTYDDLVYKVFLQEFDAVVGDVTILANRSRFVDFTLPFTDSGVTMVVPITDGQSKSAWVFIKPLSGDLWLASGCFVVFTGLVVWFLEHRVNEEFRGVPSNQVGTVFYFAFSTLVFAHREKVVSNFSRFVVIIWVFVVLILTSSYTASLTSMLTVQQLQPTVSDLSDLIKRNERVGYLNDSFMPELLKQLKVNNNRIIAYSSPDEYAAALDKGTANGGAGAIVDEIPYLKVFLSKYCCGKYAMVGPTYKTNGFGFVFPKGSPFLPDISRAVLNVTEGKMFAMLEEELYGVGIPLDKSFNVASSSLKLSNFRGLFLITGTASGAPSSSFWSSSSTTTRRRILFSGRITPPRESFSCS
ncbi:unnamed protein product [Spirodela intermedia]|uniref:Glutamate receptor n=1 Tax=Spirodela intermedia TaxID=51605 RepID=A0A7I8IYS5_SPIIN|nr:unnamed protein product [Spirodela intermedia]CAA6662293.1 unnamed protein product [Spirodela intermedia]